MIRIAAFMLNLDACWVVYEYTWGSAVKYIPFNKWVTVCIGEAEIDVSQRNVILHDNGIEFVD